MVREEIADHFKVLQDSICKALEDLDGTSTFREDLWDRLEGGGGRTRVFAGENIEKGGVNFSAVFGPSSDLLRKSLHVTDPDFFATGVSIVLHPSNPMVPIIHMNVRYFETSAETWWFGGGIDVTPHYVNREDATRFHQHLKQVCDGHNTEFYKKFKSWADDYFFIPHRNETRGIGGIFFDKLSSPEMTKDQAFEFVFDVGRAFIPIYSRLYLKHHNELYTERQKEWQLIRRGRYAEFNLVWDRGTKFGLDTNGRTESILMSLPPDVKWVYDFPVEPGSEESKTLELLQKGINWIS